MNLAIFGLHPVIKQLYWQDSSIIFVDQFQWWLFQQDDTRVSHPHKEADSQQCAALSSSAADIMARLRQWGPIWSRWSGRGDQQELLLQSTCLLVIDMIYQVRAHSIDACVFFTSISHHPITLALETACAIEGVPQIFLNSEVVTNRLLPLIQFDGILSRKPISCSISGGEGVGMLVSDFLQNKIAGGQPKSNTVTLPAQENFLASIAWLTLKSTRQVMGRLKRFIFRQQRPPGVIDFYCVYPFQHLMSFFQQRAAIGYYLRRVEPLCKKTIDSDGPELLFAAHYQPEATTFPEGGVYADHVTIIVDLRNKGYSHILYYKEHKKSFVYHENIIGPTRVSMYRSQHYYEQLEHLGCVFVDPRYELSVAAGSQQWYVPVTITGTIAIERSLVGLHTIVAGVPWYRGLPGTIQLQDVDSLNQIPKYWAEPDPMLAQRAHEFLTNLLSGTTLVNVPGIGTGIPLTSENEQERFGHEFNRLVQQIHSM